MATRIETVKELFFKKNEELVLTVNGKELKENIDTLRERKLKNYIKNRIDNLEQAFKNLCSEFDERFNNNEWILMNDDCCYINDIVALIPDIKEIECYSQSSAESFSIARVDLSFGDFDDVHIPTAEEAKVFLKDNNYKKSNGKINGEFYGITCERNRFLVTFENNGAVFEYPYLNDMKILTVPVYRFNGINSTKIPTSSVLLHWVSKKLSPKKFKIESTKFIYELLRYFYKINPAYLSFVDDSIVFVNKEEVIDYFYQSCISGKEEPFVPKAQEILNSNEFEADDLFLNFFEFKLLNCDKNRAGLDILPKQTTLYGTDTGHWDLFDYMQQPEGDYFSVKLPENKQMTAQAPNIVNTNVAIDFGTKSTVVTYEDPEHKGEIIPIKVGGYSKEYSIDEYENPSIIEFIDFDSFDSDYRYKKCRPDTKLEDLAVSHNALRDLSENEQIESYLTDLKTWCSKNEEFRFKSRKTGIKRKFSPFLEISENEENPLEYYAYFLGLNINQISKGNVYTNYKMSFPVTFKKDIRDKIIKSFENGIRKSFPKILLSDENFREKSVDGFIKQGLSEPAAYAITALERYYFGERLDDEEDCSELYYAVFDFGGGTTDFDFGYYSNLKVPTRRYDYELNHFGSIYGDEHLGGEKLLRYLSFELFKANKDKIKENNIKFAKYDGCTDKELYGLDDVISNDLYANLNILILMEELRWVWEDPEAKKHAKEKENFGKLGKIRKLQFYDKDGDKQEIELIIPQKEDFDKDKDDPTEFFQELLSKKIESGIKKFFESMKEAFRISGKDLSKIDEISIFLAGNSTKSILFNNILSEYIGTGDKATKNKKMLGNENLNFVLYHPLGTKESDEQLEKLKEKYSPDDEYAGIPPTCKTGVAYGLLKERIKVNEALSEEVDNKKFKYYLGLEGKRKFKYLIIEVDSEIDYKWTELCEVYNGETIYPFLYSSEAAAGSGNMPANRAKPGTITISKDQAKDGLKIFIRAVEPEKIEWQVARNERELRDVENPNLISLD